ncbi:MAG: DUF6796 family protein [Candidatus Caldatribacteriota bacterium]|nr:DUF6796 family protein [Candidatus Caldatribacteriota bacterium]
MIEKNINIIEDKRLLNRIMGISAIFAALMISIADFMLEFSHEYGVSSEIIEPIWRFMPEWRFSYSIYICAFLIPFYILGFWLLYKVLKKSNKKFALIIFILFSYGVIMGSPLIHTVMSMNPILYKFGIERGIDISIINEMIGNKITSVVFPVFIVHYLITWIIAPILLFIYIIRGKSIFSRWVAFMNPLIFLIVGMLGLLIFPKIFIYLAPGSINKGNALLFLMLTIKTWNMDE